MGEPRAHRPVSPEQLGNGEVMAYHHLLKKDIVILCTKRGLRIGKFTKAQLIMQLEEEDRSEERIPDPDWATRGSGSSWSSSQASPRVWSPTRRRSSRSGSPSGDRRQMGLEQSPREREDHEREQNPEKKLQEKQQQHGLAMVERRGIGGFPGTLFLSSNKPLFHWLAESHISLQSGGAGPCGFPRTLLGQAYWGKRTEGQRMLNAPRRDPGGEAV
nr:uncharacterized protein LOC116816590 [Chelonoidis abingdonii]